MSVCLSVSMMLTFSKPRGSQTAGLTSMKLGVCILCVLGQRFYEVEFWISTPNLARLVEMTHRDRGACFPLPYTLLHVSRLCDVQAYFACILSSVVNCDDVQSGLLITGVWVVIRICFFR